MKELINSIRHLARALKTPSHAMTLDDAADQLELNRWRRFGDEEPAEMLEVHVYFEEGYQGIAALTYGKWDNNGSEWPLAQPDDMWRPANLPVSPEKPEGIK